MRLAHIAPLWYPIPPQKYGGTERVISYLTETLVERGHEVTLFAAGDSKTKAKLISTRQQSLVASGVPWRDTLANTENVAAALALADQFDLIHSHIPLTAAFFSALKNKPLVHTMHNIPGRQDWRWSLFEKYKDNYNPVFISQRQKENSPVQFPHSWVVPNGIDLAIYEFNPEPEDHFIWIALVSKVKGVENAIAAAKQAGIKLLLAGKVDELNRTYFETVIKPQLNERIQFVGELGGQELVNFYKNAQALIYPIEWEEPFGLVMVEALACGTPVIAYGRGSVPEIIQTGVNGFIVGSIAEIVATLPKIKNIDRAACRRSVEEKFSQDQMTTAYEAVYQAVLNQV